MERPPFTDTFQVTASLPGPHPQWLKVTKAVSIAAAALSQPEPRSLAHCGDVTQQELVTTPCLKPTDHVPAAGTQQGPFLRPQIQEASAHFGICSLTVKYNSMGNSIIFF